jgi:hypothetical protein
VEQVSRKSTTEKSRDKRVSIEGITDAELSARLSDILNIVE